MPLVGRKKVDEAIIATVVAANDNVRGIYLGGLTPIAMETPADTGVTRNSWFLSVNNPSTNTGRAKNKSGSGSLSSILKMPVWVLGIKIYYTNNRPNINVLEYGGFPKPVKKGSYIKRSKSFEILSINGYSKQAPNGWVRTTLISMQNKIRSL